MLGLYENGQPGELFIRMNKEGGTLSGTLDVVGTLVSLCLQNGIPLKDLVNKFKNVSFPPSGFTINKNIPEASSVIDYIFSWLEKEFGARIVELHKAVDRWKDDLNQIKDDRKQNSRNECSKINRKNSGKIWLFKRSALSTKRANKY